ncbi:hypothetical protein TrLO_g14683 [Triparma laevis f. longispina]|uniref:Uncharacterized protein n=1 Tax=Triparma laevis f. longispina TaxID=1714387 RepID=A0A9W7E3M6_9STRA|nr:hypothetical protein TrLO_g14683 [Triparma laevis f. longispina]
MEDEKSIFPRLLDPVVSQNSSNFSDSGLDDEEEQFIASCRSLESEAETTVFREAYFPSIMKLSVCSNPEEFVNERTRSAGREHKGLRKRATELGKKAIDKSKQAVAKARPSLPPTFSISSKTSLKDTGKRNLPVITSYLIVHAPPSLVRKCFFDIQYFENLSKARKTLVHEHKINRDMIAYWYEKLTYSSSGYKMNEYLARYVWKEDGNDFIIAFKTVEDADVPYIFEKANIPSNRVLRVKASGYYRIVALSHGRSRIDFTATLNPTPASIIDNANHFKNEIWTFVQPLLRIRSDFDRSEEVDYAMCKDFVDGEVENPVWLSNFEEEVIMKALEYRALDENDPVSHARGGRRNSLRDNVLINARQISRIATTSNKDNNPLSHQMTRQLDYYVAEASKHDTFSNIDDAFEVSNVDDIESGAFEVKREEHDALPTMTKVQEKVFKAAIAKRDQIALLEGELLRTGWERIKNKGPDAASTSGPELFRREGFDDRNVARDWHKGVLTIATNAKNALFYIWHVDGNERTKIHENESDGVNLPRCRYPIPNSRSQIVLDSKRFPVNMSDRIYETYQVWDSVQDENGHDCYIVVWEPAKEVGCRSYKAAQDTFRVDKKNFVEGSLRGIVIIKEMAPNVCEVCVIANIQNHGNMMLPKWIKDIKMREVMDLLDDLQSKFQRNWALVDHEIRHSFAEKHFGDEAETEEQEKTMEEGQSGANANTDADADAEAEERKKIMVMDQLECSKECFALVSDDYHLGKHIEPKDLKAQLLWNEFKPMMEDKKEGSFDWNPIPSPDPLVELVHGHRKIHGHWGSFFCRGRSFVDANVGETAAYFFLINLQTNMNSFLDAGHYVRNVSSTNGVNDQIVGSVYNVQSWALAPREVVSRWVWGRVGNKIIIWMKCMNHLDVDYSIKIPNTKRIEVDQVLVIEPQVLNQVERGSRVTHFSSMRQISALVPKFFVRREFTKAALQVSSVRKEFNHNDSVDDEMLSNFLDELDEEEGIDQHMTEEENALLTRVNILKDHPDVANFKSFETSYNKDFFVDLKKKDTDKATVYMATCIMDAPVDECLFTEYIKNTRQALKDAFSDEAGQGVVNLSVKKLTRHSQLSIVEKLVKKVKMRAVEQIVWKRFDDGRAVVGYSTTEEKKWPKDGWDIHWNNSFPVEAAASTTNTVKFNEYVELKVLPSIGDVYQTRATFMIEVPKADSSFGHGGTKELFILQRLKKISQFRIRLNKSLEIDAFYRSDLAKKLVEWKTDSNKKYGDHEKIIISQGVTLLSVFENSKRRNLAMKGIITSTENETSILTEKDAALGYKGQGFIDRGNGSPDSGMISTGLGSSATGRFTRAVTKMFSSSASINPSNSNASPASSGSGAGLSARSSRSKSQFSAMMGKSGPLYKMTFKGNEKDKLLLNDLRVKDANKNLLKSYRVWTRCRAIVNGSVEDVMSYFWDFQSRCRIRKNDVERMTLEIKSDHDIVGCITNFGPNGELAEYVFEMVWYKIDPQNMCIICFPVDHYTRSGRGFRRKKQIWILSTKAIGDGSKCRMTYMTSVEYAKKAMDQSVMSAIKCQRYFLGLKDLKDLDELIGHGLGEAFMTMTVAEKIQGGKKDPKLRVEEVVKHHKGLTHLTRTYPWFKALMEGIVENKLEINMRPINVSTHDLSNRQARIVGGSLSFSMLSCLLPTSAVDEWIMRSTALQEFDVEYSWFRPMIDCMAYALLDDAHWGLTLRVVVGACICLSDIASDIVMVFLFLQQDDSSIWGVLTLASISLSILLQMFIVHINGRKNQLKEKLIVLFCLKPAVDAYRMVQMEEVDMDSESRVLLSSVSEAVFCKCVEMLFESIPSSILQAIFYLSARDEQKLAPLISIGFSCLSTGYIVTSIAYDLDIDPDTRRKYPNSHGIIPNTARQRMVSFLSMLIISSLACFQTSFAFASLYWVEPTTFVAFLLSGYVPYILFKAFLMKDWNSWINLTGKAGFVTATAHRMIEKTLNDFTFSPVWADSSEMGRFWFPSMIIGVALNWMVCKNASMNAPKVDETIEKPWPATFETLAGSSHVTAFDIWFFTTAGICVGWVAFISRGCKWDKIVPGLLWQQTGPSMYSKSWQDSKDTDRMKLVLDYNPAMFHGIRLELKEWIQDNFERWMDEETFRSSTLIHLPEYFIPEELLEERDTEAARTSVRETRMGFGTISKFAQQSRLATASSSANIRRGFSGGHLSKQHFDFSEKVRKWSVTNDLSVADQRLKDLNKGRPSKPRQGERRASNFSANMPVAVPKDFKERRRMSDKIRRDSRVDRRKEERNAEMRRMSLK